MTSQTNNGQKHMRSFWPLVIILIIAALVGGLVYWFQFKFVTDQDLQSMELVIHRRTSSPQPPTTTKKTTTTKPVQ